MSSLTVMVRDELESTTGVGDEELGMFPSGNWGQLESHNAPLFVAQSWCLRVACIFLSSLVNLFSII